MSVDTRVKLLIVNHFDDLTTQVHIYTEKLLVRFDENYLFADFVKGYFQVNIDLKPFEVSHIKSLVIEYF